jgi:hypothetical protein
MPGEMELLMTCPNCKNNIPLFKVKKEFTCPSCGSVLTCPNYSNLLLKSLAIYLAIVFVLDFIPFNMVTVIVYNILIFLIVTWIYSKKLNCSVLRRSAKKPVDEDRG